MRECVTRTDVVLRADPARVLARLFVPGYELSHDVRSRAPGVLSRILTLPEDEVRATLTRVAARYAGRHRDLPGVLRAHYARMEHRIPADAELSDERRDLVGAWFTHEYSIEGAALFNPSAVAHPDQSGLSAGERRFILSLRAVGEGHLSSVEFRTGVMGPAGELHIDDPGPHIEAGHPLATSYDRTLFAAALAGPDIDRETAGFVIARLPPRFDGGELDAALGALADEQLTHPTAARTTEVARRIAACTYEVEFAPESALPERVLWPQSPSESRGIEDARFVRIEDDSVYRATYTAFDGASITPQLIETDDFRHFRMSQLAGPAAQNKGMALFPRRVGDRYVALSRWDRENNAIASSSDGVWWGDPRTLQTPSRPWELLQLGNCGSPVETDAGWIVLTHGVGPMREYAIGALLLDLDDPSRVIGALRDPLLEPAEDERDGYVPNVVYSCGALRHGDQLLLPYGASDASVRFAFVDVPLLVDRLTADGPPETMRENNSA
jgi:predicted GH43/DUF377 family glycosyl hydrolase